MESDVRMPRSASAAFDLVKNSASVLWTARGNGRSYGDSALGGDVMDCRALNHLLHFSAETGVLRAGAGLLLDELLKVFVPRGWFLPVTPGTRYVTLAGAVASDVHGKNHHRQGTFTRHVHSLEILLGDGRVVEASNTANVALFRATCGGMGLTGLILSVELQLLRIASSEITERTVRCTGLLEVLERFEEFRGNTYSVAWIDCLSLGRHLGRSLLMLGEHATHGDLKYESRQQFRLPRSVPVALVQPNLIKLFNSFYYHRWLHERRVSIQQYFYPLDAVSNWNRLYGPLGFLQYQFAVPKSATKALEKILRKIAEAGNASFLAVLKAFGPENDNLLTFPIEGYTLALDFPVNQENLRMLELFDRIVLDEGGRVYLAKDARMSERTFKGSYKNWELFEEVRHRYAAIGVFSSKQSQRLGLQ